MLVVAVGFGHSPFTCSCPCESDEVDPHDLPSILSLIDKEHHLIPTSIDELLVIDNDQVIATYDYEDGLGQREEDKDDE